MLGTIEGTTGADVIDTAYLGDPEGEAPGAGADIVIALQGNDTVFGGAGGDSVSGGVDDDRLYGGAGDDTLRGDEGQDILFGEEGNDSLDGGTGDDTLKGGDGTDILAGGAGADNMNGNADRDTIIGGTNGDVADGGAEGDDFDALDLRGLPPYILTDIVADSNGNGWNGTVRFVDGAGNPTGESFTFAEIEQIIEDENEPPVAGDDTVTTDEDVPVPIQVLANDSDPDGDPLTVTSATATNGTVSIGAGGELTYTPNPNYYGPDTISYTISDGNGGTSIGIVSVTVNPVNDNPNAVDDTASTTPTTPVTIAVRSNDTDPESDPVTVTGVTQGTNGTVAIDGATGNPIYTPNAGFTGTDTFTYTIDDGNGGTDTATVTVTVGGGNTAPVAVDDAVTTDEDTAITIPVRGNDTDPESDPLTVTGVTQGANGSVVIDPATGNPVYTPNTDYTGTDTFTYTIDDGNGGTDTATVTVTITPVADGPDAVDDAASTDQGVPVTIPVRANDTDPEMDPLTVTAVTQGANGTVAIDPVTGNPVYTPNGGFSGSDTFTYTIDDGNGGTDTATVTVTVNPVAGPDGTVEGTTGGDVIDLGYTGDPEGDFVDNDDAILPGDTGNDDLILGFGGDDTIFAGNGDDEVVGGSGVDTLYGGDGNDLLRDANGPNSYDGGAGDDTIIAGGDVGNDSILGGTGNDVINGGAGDDVIDSSDGGVGLFDNPYPPLPVDAFPNNDLDTVFGGDGNDTIRTGDDRDTAYGGDGNDAINLGIDNDEGYGGQGDDTIVGGEGDDVIYAGAGNDVVYGGLDPSFPDSLNIPNDGSAPGGPDLVTNNGRDTIYAGDGDDTVYGLDDDDTIEGGGGNDVIDGGVDDDTISGNQGNDVVLGGQGNDTLLGETGNDTLTGGIGNDAIFGGADRDTILGGNGGDVVDGGGTGDDFDVLDLTGSNVDFITYTSPDREDGVVTFLDGSTMTFTEIENVIPCFTPGTAIATPRGERLVEELQVGDRIITRDNGIQEIRWMGTKEITGKLLVGSPHLRPIMIKAGALGNGLPERDMMVSPNHRVLVANDRTQLYFEESEVLAAAKHLVGAAGIFELDVMATSYIHFMFDRHEVVLSNGAWTESFQPGDYSLKGIGNAQRNEILELFPELATEAGLEGYQSARKSLKKHEARLLVR